MQQPALAAYIGDARLTMGVRLGSLPKEILDKVFPAERTVMLRLVSKGTSSTLCAVQPAAIVERKKGWPGESMTIVAGLAGRLEKMQSWCRITALCLHATGLGGPDTEGLAGVLGQ